MTLLRKSKIIMLAFGVVVAFGITWYRISAVTPPWGDEPRNLLVAKSLAITGEPVLWDYSNGLPINIHYTRGMAITYPLVFLYKHGLIQLIWARAVPLAYVLLTLFFWIGYLCYKKQLNATGVALLTIFFLGQPMVFEQSAFVRMYAPLGFVFSIVLVCLWGLKEAWKKRQGWIFAGLAAFCLLGLWVPKADSWQGEHIPLFLLALAMLNSYVWRACVFLIRRPVWALVVFIALLWLGPIIVIVINTWIPFIVKGFGISISRMYCTYWDNIGGLIRFFLAVNIMWWGLCWIFRSPDQRNFFSWLYLSGLLGGIFLGLFTPPQHIFFSRYFYLSIIAVTVGFAGMCVEKSPEPWVKRALIAGYLLTSILFTFVNFHFERSNLPEAVRWLKKNMGQKDVLLYYNHFYGLNDGEELAGDHVYPIKDRNIDKAIEFVSMPGIEHVYFLMNDNYKFRNILYKKTTGHDRWAVINPIADYLNSDVSGEEVLDSLWGCDLKRFEPQQVAVALTKLKENQLPRMPPWQLNFYQENVLRFMMKILGRPFRG
jgi:hypothetical protein